MDRFHGSQFLAYADSMSRLIQPDHQPLGGGTAPVSVDGAVGGVVGAVGGEVGNAGAPALGLEDVHSRP